MSFASRTVKVITNQITSVFQFLLTNFEHQWVSGLYVVIDNVVRQNTTLSLWQEEEREFFFLLTIVNLTHLMRVMDIKYASCKPRAHLSTIVPVHTKRSTLTQRSVAI